MLKEGVRLDRVRGGRQKYRNRMRIVGQASINRAEAYNGNIDGRRENEQGFHISPLPYPVGDDKIPVIKTLEGRYAILLIHIRAAIKRIISKSYDEHIILTKNSFFRQKTKCLQH